MSNWPKDNMAAKVAFYGDPRKPNFQQLNMVTIAPPFQMYYDLHPLKGINVNRKVASSLLKIFTEIADKCGHDQKKIDALGASIYAGCYNPRPIRGSATQISNHSFAAAIDIDPAHNPLGAKIGKMSPIVIDAFKTEGWLWGGDYKNRKDWMHFEAVSR